MKSFPLASGRTIPALGLGTWQLEGEAIEEPLTAALEVGFRHIDTAWIYANQTIIGKVLSQSGLPRGDLFLTSKVWHNQLEKEKVRQSCLESLKQLQTDYLDLLLIHWPNKNVPIGETLEALQELKRENLIFDFGVSNFTTGHLEEALKYSADIAVNQIEFHPSFNQKEIKAFCDQRGIIVTAYSPIAQGQDLKLPLIQKLASKYGRTAPQIILNWLVSQGIVAIPRSKDGKHLEDNWHSLDFVMDPADREMIDTLDTRNRLLNPPFAEFD